MENGKHKRATGSYRKTHYSGLRNVYATLSGTEKLLLGLAEISVFVLAAYTVTLTQIWWEPVSALAAAVAAIFAGAQIYYTRRESRRRTTFEHIREVTNSLKPLWSHDAIKLQKDVLAFYERRSEKLPDGSSSYLAFLGVADILAFAIERDTVDQEVAIEYLQTLFNGDLISSNFLDQFQQATKDPEVYRHLSDLRGSLDVLSEDQEVNGI